MMSTKDIVLITGANTGLGYETVLSLLKSPKPYHILLGSRSLDKGRVAAEKATADVSGTPSTVEAVQIDVTDDTSIQALKEHIETKFSRLDILINNAGACFDSLWPNDVGNYRSIFNDAYNVNVSGSHMVTLALAPLLIASSSPRLIFISSGTSSMQGRIDQHIEEQFEAGWPKGNAMVLTGYACSKAAVNMMMLTWRGALAKDRVKTWAVEPGFLATNLGGDHETLVKLGAGDPSRGGDLLRKIVEGERDVDQGRVVMQDGVVQPW